MGFSKKAKKRGNSRVNALPLVSSSSTSAPSKDHDSVPAKLKDVVGEEASTDSVPKVSKKEKKARRKLLELQAALPLVSGSSPDVVGEEGSTDSVPKVAAELTDRELFKIWCTMCLIIYTTKEEEERRFGIFQEALARPPTDGVNRIGFADRTPEELEIICRSSGDPEACPVYITQDHLEYWVGHYKMIAEASRKCFAKWG